MIRVGLSLLAGGALALLLFWLLALLVAPPELDIEVEKMAMSLRLVEASDTAVAPPRVAEPLPEAPGEPAPAPLLPEPAPLSDSRLAVPDPEPDSSPEPKPQPEPEPEPKPEPKPEVKPEVKPEAKPESEAKPEPEAKPKSEPEFKLAAEPAPSPAPQALSGPLPSAASREPVDVGSSARPTHRVPPQYPSRAQRRGLEGHVTVRFLIRADGSVDAGSIEVLEARPRKVFEQATRQAIAGWRFEPAEGLRWARQRLDFQLR